MQRQRARPIFVVGKQRSGTTGLANHLCEHPSIAGVQHEAHWGIHESGYYPYVVDRYGPLDRWSNFREFVAVMSASDYFRLTGVGTEFMLSLYPTSYSDFFGAVMRKFARRRGAQYWIEKTPEHTKYALQLARTYPSASFIGLVRPVEDVVASSVANIETSQNNAPNRARLLTLIRLVLGWTYYAKSIAELKRQCPSRTLFVRYEDFQARPSRLLQDICGHLHLEYDEAMETVPYARNTSFSGDSSRRQTLNDGEQVLISLLARALEAVPYTALRSLDTVVKALRPTPDLPDWFFKLAERPSNCSETLRPLSSPEP
jgi:hypothetical protein